MLNGKPLFAGDSGVNHCDAVWLRRAAVACCYGAAPLVLALTPPLITDVLVARCCLRRVLAEIDELYKVFQVLGTPTEAVWPGAAVRLNCRASFFVACHKQLLWDPLRPHVPSLWRSLRRRVLSRCPAGVTSMPDFSPSFPHWPPMLWSRICPQLDEHGVDLMRSMLCYDPARRITARTACQHPYFKDLVARRTGSSASAPPGSSPAAPAAPAAAASASAAAGAAGMYPADTAPSGDGGGSAGFTPLHMSDA
jgi:serine/threonine protein kinase